MRDMRKMLALIAALCLMALLSGAAMGEGETPDAGNSCEMTIEETLMAQAASQPDSGLEVFYLDLGRVDGILIRCDGVTSFIDVGFKADAKPAIAYMHALGVEHLDSYIASHGHADHIEGAPQIIAAMKPDTLYAPHRKCLNTIAAYASNNSESSAIEAAKKTVLSPGDSFMIGQAKATCLGPLSIRECGIGSMTENDNSLIFRLDYGSTSFLFTGDTSDGVLRSVNKKYPGELDVDVLKNPHHNGAHEADVIRAISPKITIFCTDNENYPLKTYRRALKDQGSEVYMTGSENCGNILVRSDGMTLEVVSGYPLEKLELDPLPTLYVGQEYTVTGSIEPASLARTDRWLGWKSSDEGVVKVSGGKLKAVAEGTATITATSFNGLSASSEVRVMSVGVILETYDITLGVGDEKRLRAKILPKGSTGVTGEWVSADENIAVVTANGDVIGVHEGETQVFARLSNGAEAACNVTVTGFAIESVKLDQTKATMKEGEQLVLHATVKPDYGDVVLQWASSDENILWVDSEGTVTAVRKGKAKIGVRASNGMYDICTITVE